MNYTIYGAGVGPAGNNHAQPASINIRNNTEKTDGGSVAGFQGVVVSAGTALETKKLDENTYKALLNETEDVKAQLMASATNARASLKALFNRLSGADAVRIDEDGFNLNEAQPEELVNIVDRIKIELAAHGEGYPLTGSGVSVDKIQQVVGSAGYAQAIAGKMQESGVPLTPDNVSELAEALKQISGREYLSEPAKNYMVQNHLEPTIENVYLAEHAAGVSAEEAGASQGTPAADTGTARGLGEPLSEADWKHLKPQIEKMLKQAGLEANEQDFKNAKTFIEQGLPVTVENLAFKASLDRMELAGGVAEGAAGDIGPVADRIIRHMAEGQSAASTPLTGEPGVYAQVVRAMEIVQNADYGQVAHATQYAEEHQQIFNLKCIEAAAQEFTGQQEKNASKQELLPAEGTHENVAAEGLKEQALSNYRMLMQVQIMMTASAGVFVARQGISLTTVSIAELEMRLEAYDRKMFLRTDGEVEETSDRQAMGSETERIYQMSFSVRRALFEIKYAPDVTVGAVLGQQADKEAVTITDFAEMGRNLRERFRQAGQTYEAVGTQKRTDLGDTFAKAVRASTDGLLDELGLEHTKANSDAVRILGFNSLEITTENIERVKELHSTLNSLVKHMSPDKVLNMLRENINPMSEDIHTVDAYLKAQESGADNGERFSSFLYKLERTDGITAEERTQFIGIYKMMNMFTKDAGAAIGTLVKQNADITMENLCMAYSSRKSYGMEASIEDGAEIAAAGRVNYYLNLFDETGYSITPLTLRNVQQKQPIASRSVENFCEESRAQYDSKEEAAYYESYLSKVRSALEADSAVARELERVQQPVTIANIQAMEQMMQGGYLNTLFSGYREQVSKFVDKAGRREELEQVYEELRTESDGELLQAVSGETQTEEPGYEEFETLRMKNRQIRFIADQSLRHDYHIPFLTEEGIGMMKLTLVSDEEDHGRISLNFESETFGTVSVEAKVAGQEIGLYGVCVQNEDLLTEKLENTAQDLQASFNVSKAEVCCSRSEWVSRIKYEQAARTTATNQLYQMAKTIILSLV